MREKLSGFLHSHYGHIAVGFAAYCLSMFLLLTVLQSRMPEGGLNALSDSLVIGVTETGGETPVVDVTPPVIPEHDTATVTDPVTDTVPDKPPATGRIAVVMGEMGLSRSVTVQALEELPPEISLAFSPYAENLPGLIFQAKNQNRSVLLEIPMEPYSFPDDDPGPAALLTRNSHPRNQAALEASLQKAEGISGVMPWMGQRFMATAEYVDPLIRMLRAKNLYMIDGTTPRDLRETAQKPTLAATTAQRYKLPYLGVDIVLDETATRAHIMRQLRIAEEAARATDEPVIAFAQPYPVTVEVLRDWEKTLQTRNITLVPVEKLARSKVQNGKTKE
ncbi:MAG: divergent polysaccharide deacetylase family protein [Pseudomonadota bacterium]|nr:divergent polysaccharide deacetylase family protein [Pseudomonadota bacterium]QKK04966.1 MAG: divergent polysaccharide deacetylase family protein [Pseudomonadota bacterium]